MFYPNLNSPNRAIGHGHVCQLSLLLEKYEDRTSKIAIKLKSMRKGTRHFLSKAKQVFFRNKTIYLGVTT